MIVVVNDANVLIDLVKLQLLPHFFSLLYYSLKFGPLGKFNKNG